MTALGRILQLMLILAGDASRWRLGTRHFPSTNVGFALSADGCKRT